VRADRCRRDVETRAATDVERIGEDLVAKLELACEVVLETGPDQLGRIDGTEGTVHKRVRVAGGECVHKIRVLRAPSKGQQRLSVEVNGQ